MRAQQEPALLLELGETVGVHDSSSSSSAAATSRRSSSSGIVSAAAFHRRNATASPTTAHTNAASRQRPHERVDAGRSRHQQHLAAEALLDVVDDLVVADRAGVDLAGDLDADRLRVGVARLEHALAVADRAGEAAG